MCVFLAGSLLVYLCIVYVVSGCIRCVINLIAAIKKLKSNLSAGPDGLPPLLFKRITYAIATPLTLLFKQMLCATMVI